MVTQSEIESSSPFGNQPAAGGYLQQGVFSAREAFSIFHWGIFLRGYLLDGYFPGERGIFHEGYVPGAEGKYLEL